MDWVDDHRSDGSDPNGVWLVITDPGGYDERLLAVFPWNEELQARRMADELGYGTVRFMEFGELR